MDRLAHYSILEKIGEGGMGEVFRARDDSLGREVAIKILPAALSGDPARLARFEREARLLASLNHSGIAAIHGLHEDGGVRFLAMEYVPGENLAQRLARGPLPVDEALRAAERVAEALESAHEKGIIHRDLKPANLIVTDDAVKILDFGLAKMLDDESETGPQSSSDLSKSPTLLVQPTVGNVILGTASYMSPEQARGKRVDRRSDVWAFGCVLYEMLTGQQAFRGETITDTIGAVLHVEPDWSRLPAATPAAVRTLLRRCLEKDRAKRLRDVGDALIVIREALAGGGEAPATAAAPRRASWLPIAGTAVVAAAIAVAVTIALRPTPAPPPVTKFAIPVEKLHGSFAGVVFPSPDGRRVAYNDNERIEIRAFDDLQSRTLDVGRPVSGGSLAWSPDGGSIAYDNEGKLWKVAVAGGRPVQICDLPETGRILHAAWGPNGSIAFTAWRGGLYSVSAEGGAPDTLLAVDHEKIVDFHRVEFLPDGSLIFDVHRGGERGEQESNVQILRPGASEPVTLPLPRSAQMPVYSPTGHILFGESEGESWRLMAVPFSPSRMKVTGKPFRVADNAFGATACANGLLVYVTSVGAGARQLIRVDRTGAVAGTVGQDIEGLSYPALSPDGAQVVVAANVGDEEDLWILDVRSGARRRLTFSGGGAPKAGRLETTPAWTPDGRNIVFARDRNLKFEFSSIRADGSGRERSLFSGMEGDFSSDGRHFVYNTHGLDARDELWRIDVPEGGDLAAAKPVPFLAPPAQGQVPHFSPDGRFVAYESRESGSNDVFLTQFPGGEGRWQISTGGGRDPRWRPDGKAVYYVNEGALYEVPVRTEPSVLIGTPKKLFGGGDSEIVLRAGYDVTADGRFLVVRRAARGGEGTYAIVVVQNWYEPFRGR